MDNIDNLDIILRDTIPSPDGDFHVSTQYRQPLYVTYVFSPVGIEPWRTTLSSPTLDDAVYTHNQMVELVNRMVLDNKYKRPDGTTTTPTTTSAEELHP